MLQYDPDHMRWLQVNDPRAQQGDVDVRIRRPYAQILRGILQVLLMRCALPVWRSSLAENGNTAVVYS